MAVFKKGDVPWNKGIKTGISFRRGVKMSDESKLKMRNAKLGTHQSEEHKKNISKSLTARGKFISRGNTHS